MLKKDNLNLTVYTENQHYHQLQQSHAQICLFYFNRG